MANTTLDLQFINTYKLNSIAIADISTYSVNPTNTSMQVFVPGYNIINVTFIPKVVNIYNATNLISGITEISTPLPDGIYTFKYSVNPNTVNLIEKSFMRTSTIDCKYYKAFLALEFGCNCNGFDNKNLKNKLQDIRLLIDGSIAASNQCDTITAYELYCKADNLLNKIKTCDC